MESIEISIDSRFRDTNKYHNPNFYSIDLPSTYKNVHSIEILRKSIPQTQYVLDEYNNILYYQFENENVIKKHIQPSNNIHTILNALNHNIDPCLFSFSIENGKIVIFNNTVKKLTFLFSKEKSLGHLLSFPYDITLEGCSSITAHNQITFQKEPYVYININGYENMENVKHQSFFHKHLFNKEYDSKQVFYCKPILGKLYKLDISFLNYNNCLYNFHGYNHSFNVKIKYE